MSTRRTFLPAAALVLAGAAVPSLAGVEPAASSSVVRIVNYSQRADWATPWNSGGVRESVASGFVIEGGLVMTNAHAVSDSRMLVVYLHDDPNPYQARVEQIAHDCDLALVRPEDPALLRRVRPLRLGGLPTAGSTVETLGYPAGGTYLSSTQGVVSRIEAQVYVHSGADRHLAGQTDAPINPGNSGGPVLQNGKVVGVAFQAAGELENVGYFIPTEVIERFLVDVADGRYDGYPELGVDVATLDNPAARRRAGLADGQTGVRVDRVWRGASARGHLREGDLLLAVDGQPIANDGSVADGALRIPFGMLVDRRQFGESVRLDVLRGGERVAVEVPLAGADGVSSHQNAFDRLPRYFVYAGLVFVPLELEVLKTFGANWAAQADRVLLHEFVVRPYVEDDLWGRERVVLLRRLDHPVNADLAFARNQAVERVNGRLVRRIEDLIEALEANTGDFHEIEFSNFRRFAVLDRRAAAAAGPEILERYGVPKDRRL